ncbi:MAG: RNA polymerase sigma factor [bacterium]
MMNQNITADNELIDGLRNNNESAFRSIFDSYHRVVLNTCFRFVNNKETAEDLVQEVFIEVHRSVKHFRGEAKLSTWIYRIAVSKSLDFLKAQKRGKRFAFLKSLSHEDDMDDQVPSKKDDSPDIDVENEDRVRILNWALNSISENQRIAFTLSHYDEMSYKEIASVLGTTVSAVESLVHRAKKNLEKKLFKYYKNHL